MDPLVSPETLLGTFGPHAFQSGLFYLHEPALRFELSREGPRVDLFVQAFDRAREVLAHLFRDVAEVTAVVAWFGAGPPLRHREVFRALRACGLRRIPRPRACWAETFRDEWGEEPRTLVSFRLPTEHLHRLLWGALAADIAIEPRLPCRVYFLSPELGVLVHPYDDRGMDVIGPGRERMAELFARFGPYLLDYDRERMEGFFGAPPGN